MSSVETKVVIANLKENGDWFNVESNEGKQIGINKTKNPVTAAKLATAKVGDEIVLSLWEKEGKFFGFDVKANSNGASKGGFKPAAKDKSFDAALAAAQAAAAMLSLKKEATTADFDSMFEHIHGKIMGKASK